MRKLDDPARVEPGDETLPNPTKAQLQERVEEAQESISQTVEQIKGTVEEQFDAVKQTVGGVLSIGKGFQQDPLLWSLGALSAGFAVGYTLGYGNQHAKLRGRLPTPLAEFVDDLARELSKVGHNLVLPSLDAHIKTAFGFDLSSVLEEIGTQGKRRHIPKRAPVKAHTRRRTKKKPPKRG